MVDPQTKAIGNSPTAEMDPVAFPELWLRRKWRQNLQSLPLDGKNLRWKEGRSLGKSEDVGESKVKEIPALSFLTRLEGEEESTRTIHGKFPTHHKDNTIPTCAKQDPRGSFSYSLSWALTPPAVVIPTVEEDSQVILGSSHSSAAGQCPSPCRDVPPAPMELLRGI